MGSIATTDARALFTKMLMGVYKERPQVTGLLRSFFPDKVSMTKELSIEVERGTEKVASDVIRGSIGNRNTFDRSTEKIFIPPYLREYFEATELSLYDRLFGSTSIEAGVFTAFLEQVSEKLGLCQDKMERRHELMCAEVILTGTVHYDKSTDVDFKRKSASNIDKGAGNYWTTGTVNPVTDFENGGKFIRQKGKTQGGVYNAILGDLAFNALLENDIFKERYDIRDYDLGGIREPQRNAVGGTLHGRISAGSYKFNIWTYPEYYDHQTTGVSTPYISEGSMVILPENPKFEFGFAAPPQLATTDGGVKKAKFLYGDYIDERKKSHAFDVQSAGLPIPKAIDQIYTAKVVGS